MISEVKSVPLEASIKEVSDLMEKYKIRHVPVVDKGNLAGLICRSDLARWLCDNKWEPEEIKRKLFQTDITEIMTRKVIAVSEDHTIEEAAEILSEKEFHCLPVVRGGKKLVGIVTTIDIIRALLSRTRFLI